MQDLKSKLQEIEEQLAKQKAHNAQLVQEMVEITKNESLDFNKKEQHSTQMREMEKEIQHLQEVNSKLD